MDFHVYANYLIISLVYFTNVDVLVFKGKLFIVPMFKISLPGSSNLSLGQVSNYDSITQLI